MKNNIGLSSAISLFKFKFLFMIFCTFFSISNVDVCAQVYDTGAGEEVVVTGDSQGRSDSAVDLLSDTIELETPAGIPTPIIPTLPGGGTGGGETDPDNDSDCEDAVAAYNQAVENLIAAVSVRELHAKKIITWNLPYIVVLTGGGLSAQDLQYQLEGVIRVATQSGETPAIKSALAAYMNAAKKVTEECP